MTLMLDGLETAEVCTLTIAEDELGHKLTRRTAHLWIYPLARLGLQHYLKKSVEPDSRW